MTCFLDLVPGHQLRVGTAKTSCSTVLSYLRFYFYWVWFKGCSLQECMMFPRQAELPHCCPPKPIPAHVHGNPNPCILTAS
jgi:hypothetical protein